MSDEQDVNEGQDQPVQPESEQLIWDMPKLRRWIEAGSDPASDDVIDVYILKRIEADGMIEMVSEEETAGRPRLHFSLTAMGEFEADRLEALQAKAAGEKPA